MLLISSLSVLICALIFSHDIRGGISLYGRAIRKKIFRTKKYSSEPLDSAMLLDFVATALMAGASLPKALTSVETALEHEEHLGLDTTSRLLMMGASWAEAWADVSPRAHPLRDCLESAWQCGAPPIPLLERYAASVRQSRSRALREAASELGAKLVLPLGLCFLPAFVILGVLPVVLSTGLSLFS